MKKSESEKNFLRAWQAHGMPGSDLAKEYKFAPDRKWRFDFAFPSQWLAVEIEGRGRHQMAKGVRNDCEKYNTALVLGWRVMRFPTELFPSTKIISKLSIESIELVNEALFAGNK